MRPEDYGMRTIHTGNRKHPAVEDWKRELAKEWGNLHGYKGELDGWIYDKNGQHVAHGWGIFWTQHAMAIYNWAVETGRIVKDKR